MERSQDSQEETKEISGEGILKKRWSKEVVDKRWRMCMEKGFSRRGRGKKWWRRDGGHACAWRRDEGCTVL